MKYDLQMSDLNFIKNKVSASIEVKEKITQNNELLNKINEAAHAFVDCFKGDGKVFFCGNGGSAADAQHISAELSGRFYKDRKPLYSEAFHVNSSYITAVANDYGYEDVYSRMAEACCRKGDILVGISTSGNSPNIIKAFEKAKSMGTLTIAMTGESGGKMKDMTDILINVPSSDTPRIQESHILIGHIICEITENELFG